MIRYAKRATQWSAKLRDIHEWLVEIGIRVPAAAVPQTVTRHAIFATAKKITCQPRQVLAAIPGLKSVELPESTWCCGSAGIYNITQPEMSQKLLGRKISNIKKTGGAVVASANPGFSAQLQAGLRQEHKAAE